MSQLCRALAILLVTLLASACGGDSVLTPSELDAVALEGLWVSADSLDVDGDAVGLLELTLQATPEALWSIGGTWRLGTRTGDVAPGLMTSEGEVILGLSGGAQVRGPWSGEVIAGTLDGPVFALEGAGPQWDFSGTPVTLIRQN